MKTSEKILSLTLALAFTNCFSQQINRRIGVDTTQSMYNHDQALGLVEKNGTFYMVGETKKTLTTANGQVYDYGIFWQLNSSGTLFSSKKSSFKQISCIDMTTDDKFIVGGTGSGFFCTSGHCKADMLVAKIDANATVVWGRSFGNTIYNGSDGIRHVKQTSDGNVVAVGNLYQTTNTSHAFVAKLNGTNGDSIWARTLPVSQGWAANHVSETTGGDLFIGLSNGLMVSKLSSSGAHLWTVSLSQYGEVIKTIPLSDGSVICAGHYPIPPANNYNLCVFKLSSTGALLWFKTLHATQVTGSQEMVSDFTTSQDGGYYLGGYYYSNTTYLGEFPLVAKLDANGNLVWVRSFPGAYSEVSALHERPNSNLMVCVKLGSSYNYNHPDIVISTFDKFGTSNTCWNTFSLSPITNNTVTASARFPGNWTGFETQLTIPNWTSINYWQGQYCSNSTVGLNEEKLEKNFNLNVLAYSNIEIADVDGSSFNYSVYDLNGKMIRSGRSETNGKAIVNLEDVGAQLLIVKAWSNDEQKMQHFKLLHN